MEPDIGVRGDFEVSVVIPLFNKRDTIRRALASALRQDVPGRLEIIVVDDGSTDSGPDVVRAIGDPRVRVLHQANAGVSAARNTGVSAASFNLIAFLDADDEWTNDFLPTIRRLKSRFPECGLFGTNYIRYNTSDKRRVGVPGYRQPSYSYVEGVLSEYLEITSWFGSPICASGLAARREALASVNGFPVGIHMAEDVLTWVRIATKWSVAYSPVPCVRYYVSPESRVSKGLDFAWPAVQRRVRCTGKQVNRDPAKGTLHTRRDGSEGGSGNWSPRYFPGA